ncbi:MAG: polysaccharide biosynthesis tyrosine autokinase [Pleurocapsa sp. MO_192.B19]|nr:polysaccharide biosynthesis tyrosine autokinase [Pleurocapsa sp. MO_192.B19]
MSKSLIATDDNLTFPPQQELNLMSFWRTIKRKALPIAGIAGIVTAMIWYSNRNYMDIYQGDFQLLLEPVTSEAKLSEPSTLVGSSKQVNVKGLETDYSTIITILKSPGMLSDVVRQVQTQYPEFNIEQLQSKLTINRIGSSKIDQTKIIEISYQDSEPKLTQLVLEETANKYLNYSLEERKTHIGQGVKFIEEQLPELHSRVEILQTKLQNLQEQNQLIDPQSKGENLLEQVSELRIQQLETRNELKKLKVLEENLQKRLKVSPNEAVVASNLSEDSNYQALLEQYKAVESEIATESVLFQSNSPKITRLEEKRQNLLQLLSQEQRRIIGTNSTTQARNSPLLSLQNSISSEMAQQLVETTTQIELLKVQNQSLTTTINQFEQQVRKIPSIARQYTELQQELTIANQTLQQLLTQRDSLRIELAQSQVPWELVSQPELLKDSSGNPTPISTDSEKKLMFALMGGLLSGIATTVFLEKSRDIFYTSADIEDTIKSPLLGTITWDKIAESQNILPELPSSSLLVHSPKGSENLRNSNTLFVEAFDSLYANLRFRFTEPPIRSLIVSSATREEGASTIALNLAETAAATGQKVLLIDANLYHPQLHRELNLPNQKGLQDLLSDQINTDEVVQQSSTRSNLSVLTSGQLSSDYSKLLASNRMQQLIKEFNQAFDLVIYDTPPILECMDTSFLATHTDGILMAVAISKTKKSLVTQALNQIKSFNLKLLGVISTQVL